MIEDHRPRRRFSQNFLQDSAVIERIIKIIDPQPDNQIVEIGPGKGALTRPLLRCGAHLDVIELDRELAGQLATRLNRPTNLHVHQFDVLKFNFATLYNNQALRIIGNLPYNISTPLLFHLNRYKTVICDMIFMLQKEVVARICAKPNSKEYGQLSVILQYDFDVEALFDIEPTAFAPSPKVYSTMLRLIPLKKPKYDLIDQAIFLTIVKCAFAQRRKTIQNALKHHLPKPNVTGQLLKQAGIEPERRAQTLSMQDFITLANHYYLLTKSDKSPND